jgi:hypothetical protein
MTYRLGIGWLLEQIQYINDIRARGAELLMGAVDPQTHSEDQLMK